MRITTWAEYGLICALHLAKRAGEGPITGREIASGERLPADYVEQILLRLRRAGLVQSVRGAKGGYFLAKDPEVISVRDVMAASEHQTFEIKLNLTETHRSIKPVSPLVAANLQHPFLVAKTALVLAFQG